MSNSSECSSLPARRPSHYADVTEEQPESQKQTESRRSSRYEIYGSATRPFGESYRRSLLVTRDPGSPEDPGQEPATPPTTPVDPDSVEDTMGCSTSRTQVAASDEAIKKAFAHTQAKVDPAPVKSDVKVNGVVMKTVNNNTINNCKDLSDFEIIYGTENTTKNNIDEGYSTTDIYSEVRKNEKVDKESNQTNKSSNQTPREKLMQQIRDRKDESKEVKDNGYCCVATVETTDEIESKLKHETNFENEINSTKRREDNLNLTNNIVTSEPISFVEEEYSYEPGKKEATSKLVVRSRSLMNLDHNKANYNGTCTLKRPNTLKMTTKPDGTIRYGLRQGSSEPDLLDDDESSPVESDIKSNYVSSIKSAFDAAIESQAKDKTGRAEAFDGLRQYFHDNKHGLHELLINNNVVIIEPFRPEPPKSPSEKSDTSSQRTCRITGATIKSPTSEQKMFMPSNTLPRRHTKCNQSSKQGFYHPIKVNKELIDAELPDPDKVKNAKELFEKIFKSRSIAEIPTKKTQSRSFFNTITSKMRITPEVKVIKEGKKVTSEKRKPGRLLMDQVETDDMKRCTLHRRWTDSGSLSSGVSSDFSCDQDYEYSHQEGANIGSNQGILEEYSSDDDIEYIYPYDDTERHPVSPEVLQKIRACGTTVTYYGGRIISRSHGPLRSPMTMTIMDEIRKHGGTHEGRKKFEEEEPTLGVKFRLVKSHSCGSRLEIAGTEEELAPKMTSPRHESFRGKSIAEEVNEVKEETCMIVEEDNQTSLEEEEDKAEADRYVTTVEVETPNTAPAVMTWAELKLKEARKQWHCAPEAVRAPPQDMEFETFEVLEDPQPHKQEKTETGRG